MADPETRVSVKYTLAWKAAIADRKKAKQDEVVITSELLLCWASKQEKFS
jgi:hypothetical protein